MGDSLPTDANAGARAGARSAAGSPEATPTASTAPPHEQRLALSLTRQQAVAASLTRGLATAFAVPALSPSPSASVPAPPPPPPLLSQLARSRPLRGAELAHTIAAKQAEVAARRALLLASRKGRAHASFEASLATLSVVAPSSAALPAAASQPPPPPPPPPRRRALSSIGSGGGAGAYAADFGQLVETPKSELWREHDFAEAPTSSAAAAASQHRAPRPQLLRRLLERTPQRLSGTSRMRRALLKTTDDDSSEASYDDGDNEFGRSRADEAAAPEAEALLSYRTASVSPSPSPPRSRPATDLSPAAITAALSVAGAKRERLLAGRVQTARVQSAEVVSRLTLLRTAQQRQSVHARVVSHHAEADASVRRAELLLARAHRALEHAERVSAVRARVAAAKRLQRWLRFRRILRLGEREAEDGAHECGEHVVEAFLTLPPPAQAQAPLLPTATHEPPPSLGERVRAARAAVAILTAPASRHALQLLRRVLVGQPVLDDFSSLAAARAAALEEERAAYLRSGRVLPHVEASSVAPASSPFITFDDAALAIQQRGVLSAAQVVTTALLRANALLEDGAVGSTAVLSSALRPGAAKSPRTLLAALLVAYFPQDILASGFVGPGERSAGSAAKRARDAELASTARRLLAAMHSLIGVVAGAPPVLPGPSSKEEAADAARTLEAQRLAYGLDSLAPDLGLDASAHVPPDLRSALAAEGSADSDADARVLHALLCTTQAWVSYMDSFSAWKDGDGARIAQTLVLPYRALLARRRGLEREAGTRIGMGDAGLDQLRIGVEGQLSQLHQQLVTLLGAPGADKWERDQHREVEAERVREARRRAASKPAAAPAIKPAAAQSFAAAAADSRPSLVALPAAVPGSPPRARGDALTQPALTPPRAGSTPSMALVRGLMSNDVLAHELILDPSFRLPEPVMGEDLQFYRDEALEGDEVAPGGGLGGAEPPDLDIGAPRLVGGGEQVQVRASSAGADSGPVVELQQLAQRVARSQAAASPVLAAALAQPPRAPRARVRGSANVAALAGDPTVLTRSAAFWEAALRAAEEQAQADASAAALREASAAVLGRPPTAQPLLQQQHHAVDLVCAGLDSVREALQALVPNRADMQASIGAQLDTALFRRMLQNRAYSHADWLALLRFICSLISSLEAPARQEATRTWLASAEAHVRRIAQMHAERAARAGRELLSAQAATLSVVAASPTLSTPPRSPTLVTSRTPVLGPALPPMQLASAAGRSLAAAPSAPLPLPGRAAPAVQPILDAALLSLLPRVFAFAHYKIALIRLDTSNHHLAVLAPFLAEGGKGAEYERARFDAALAKGEARLVGTRRWLAQALDESAELAAAAEGATTAAEAAAAAAVGEGAPSPVPRPPRSVAEMRALLSFDSRLGRLVVLRDGLLSPLLIANEHPLTTIAAACAHSEGGYVRVVATAPAATDSSPPPPQQVGTAVSFPETLQLDAKRLEALQNVLQRVALVCTLSALVQQAVTTAPEAASAAPAGAAGAEEGVVGSLAELQMRIVAWLADDNLRLEDVTAGLVAAADSLCRRAGRVPLLPPLAPDAEPAEAVASARQLATLTAAIGRAVSTAHPLFRTFQRRALESLRQRVTRELQRLLPLQSAAADADTREGAAGARLAVVWWRLVAAAELIAGTVATSVPACCAADVEAAARALARLLRHNHAVFEQHYRGLMSAARAAVDAAGPGGGGGPGSGGGAGGL